MAEFSKVHGKDAMRLEHVSLFLLPIDGKPCGNVHAPLLLAGNIVSGEEVMESLPAAEAVRVAKRLAEEAGTNVDVSDPEGLWRSEWGALHWPPASPPRRSERQAERALHPMALR